MAAVNEAASAATSEGWPNWQIALAVGVPVTAIGAAGVWIYKKRKTKPDPEKQKIADETPIKGPEKDDFQLAQAAKNKGNKFFKAGKYDKSIECYTESIQICPADHREEIATFYQNRAAAYEQLKSFDNVIKDCTKALEYNNKYVKALFRRAKAYELKNDLTQCLEDVTAVCILESFANQQSLFMADRVLKDLGRARAKEKYQNRRPQDPSPQFIRSYFSAFSNDPLTSCLSETQTCENGIEDDVKNDADDIEHVEKGKEEVLSSYKKAVRLIGKRRYSDVVRLCTSEIETEGSTHLVEALLLRATFYLLRGETDQAMVDFEKLLNMNDVDRRIRSNALIKRGSLKMQLGQQDEALEDFNSAVDQDPNNSDIYHHRGQLNLLTEKLEEAVSDFKRSVELNSSFSIAHVQKCFTDFRLAATSSDENALLEAIESFESALQKFPNCAEGYALYGQALIDMKRFEKADENFKKAIELEPDNGNIYVHRGLLRLQWKQDIDEASRLISRAMDVDDKCEFAYETLGTIEIQRGCLDRAIELFNKAINLSKTEAEMAHLYSLLDAAMAQARVAQNFGIQLPGML